MRSLYSDGLNLRRRARECTFTQPGALSAVQFIGPISYGSLGYSSACRPSGKC